MIRIQLFGNLGNQMFQYAFAVIQARKLKTRFFLDTVHVKYALRYFRISFPHSLLNYSLFYKINIRLQKLIRFKKRHDYSSCLIDFSAVTIENGAEYIGYFQNSKIYKDNFELVKDLFQIREKYKKQFRNNYAAIFNQYKTIVVSIRLGDYNDFFIKELDNIAALIPHQWYSRQLAKFNFDEYKIFVISDDPALASQLFPVRHSNIVFVNEHYITQFQMLLQCDISIIANSTFSWWGAFLNEKPGKRVIAPDYFLGYNAGTEYPKGIMCDDFEWCS